MADRLGIGKGSQTYQDFAAIAHDLLHPESYLVTMRNIIWALKARDLCDKRVISEEQILYFVGGWEHRYLGFFLRNPQIAENYFKLFKYDELIKKLFPNTSEFVYKSYVYYPNGASKYIEHEGMKRLIIEPSINNRE